jgi:transposase-like protein
MDYQEVLSAIRSLPLHQQGQLIVELTGKPQTPDYISLRREQLVNKQIGCPHCKGLNYYQYGKDKGRARFKCKGCGRTFTEHTGTWLAGIHKKELVNDYIGLMHQEKSLDKIKKELGIHKKTAFDWRHKILSSLEESLKANFNGIVESDETFFLQSDKGRKGLDRIPRKRGGKSSSRGISDDQVAVIVTADRKGTMDMKVATFGRISKKDIEKAIGNRIDKGSTLCADGHVSYKGFAKDNQLPLVVLRADLKQHIKKGIYHIQNVNSLHNRVKKWIDSTFWGVSTKYLQNYLNWYRIQESFKNSLLPAMELVKCSTVDLQAKERFRTIPENYHTLLATQF